MMSIEVLKPFGTPAVANANNCHINWQAASNRTHDPSLCAGVSPSTDWVQSAVGHVHAPVPDTGKLRDA